MARLPLNLVIMPLRMVPRVLVKERKNVAGNFIEIHL